MTGDAELYPQYCHHLAPTFGQWCLLPTTTIRCLDSRYDVFERPSSVRLRCENFSLTFANK